MKIYSIVFLMLFQLPIATLNADNPKTKTPESLVFKSVDGGQTWLDISKARPDDPVGRGLPVNPQGEGEGADRGMYPGDASANNSGFFLRLGDGLYFNEPNSIASTWKKESFPENMSNVTPGINGFYAFNFGGKILYKANGTGVWSPVFTTYKGTVRTVFESAGGAVLIGSDNGLYKSTDNGKTWKQVHAGGWAIKLVEANGVLLATSTSGIIRSEDGGEHWTKVISEGGVGIDVARIKGGFAAITFNTTSQTRRVRASYDGGKTWQAIDAGLQANIFREPTWQPMNASFSVVTASDSAWHPQQATLPAQAYITTIIQVGQGFFCGHPDGIYRSFDQGKTWKLILPSVKGKLFNLSVSGNVIYAVIREMGC